MRKRVLLPVLFILIALGAVGAWKFLVPHRTEAYVAGRSDGLQAVPDDAVWIIESKSVPDLLKALIQSDPLFPAIKQIGSIGPYLRAFRSIDSLITGNSRFRDLYAHRPVILSWHQVGKDHYQFLLVLQMDGQSNYTRAGELFSELCGRQGQWSQRMYNDKQINRITFGAESLVPGISLAEHKNFLLLSPSPILLENSVRQVTSETGLQSNESIMRLSRTAGRNALAHIYVNLRLFPSWLATWLHQDTRKTTEGYTRYGDWASLDLSVRRDAVWLNGFAVGGDTLNSYLNLFRSMQPRKLDAERYLPAGTAAYFTTGVEKPAQFLKSLSVYMGSGDAGRRRQRSIAKAFNIIREDVVKAWTDLGYRELALGYLCGVSDQSVRPFALVEVKSGKQATEQLLRWLTGIKLTDKPAADFRRKPFTDAGGKEYSIYPMPFEGLPLILGGGIFSRPAGLWFTCIEDVLVLADDPAILEEVLHKYSLGKTLANDMVYKSLSGLLSTRSNATFFAIPFRARPILENIFSETAAATFLADDRFLMKTGAVGMQFDSESDMSLHNLFVSFAEIDYSRPQTIWESRLEAPVYSRPAIVQNQVTRDNEILVQDEAANLYLINSSGRILWKMNPGEKIMSEIIQIDLVKKGRQDYLFSTQTGIHLIDRNGAYVQGYPVRLPGSATNGVALMDLDKNRDFRLFIACSDNKVYAYDRTGNPAKSWKPYPTEGAVVQPVQHFKIQNRDYLVFADPLKVHILDRKGAVKITPDTDFPVCQNSPVALETLASGPGSRLLTTDIDGNVRAILLDGRVETKKYGAFGPDHFFCAEDLNRDGFAEYVFADHSLLEVFNRTGERIAEHKLDADVSGIPVIYTSGGSPKIGLATAARREILLLNPDGTVCTGFPLAGTSPFTVVTLDKSVEYQNLLVGNEGGYLYNYAIK